MPVKPGTKFRKDIDMRTDQNMAAKAMIILISIILGIVVFFLTTLSFTEAQGYGYSSSKKLTFDTENLFTAIALMLIVWVVYPLVAAVVISICEALRLWAYKGKIEQWDQGTRLRLGAVWPLTFICSLIVYLFLGLINRIF
jgi:sterol desaturase/sphingolipid hydroxylase (fatty acid hydroxylase superfamily)